MYVRLPRSYSRHQWIYLPDILYPTGGEVEFLRCGNNITTTLFDAHDDAAPSLLLILLLLLLMLAAIRVGMSTSTYV